MIEFTQEEIAILDEMAEDAHNSLDGHTKEDYLGEEMTQVEVEAIIPDIDEDEIPMVFASDLDIDERRYSFDFRNRDFRANRDLALEMMS